MTFIKRSALAVAWLAVGCGGQVQETPTETPSPTPTLGSVVPADAPTWHEHVSPIIQRNCLSCHVEVGGSAPFPLESYAQAKPLAAAIADSVGNRRMPPWGLDGSGACNTFVNGRWLEQAEIDVITEWGLGYRAEGDPALAPEVQVPEAPVLDSVGATLDLGVDYEPNANLTDDYRCFVVDPGVTRDQYLTGFDVHPGNDRIVHHVLVYDVLTQDNVAQAEALDAAEPGPGYTCFGTPRTAAASPLIAWAPGTPPQHYPAGTGLRVSKDRKLVIQMHYNMLASEPGDLDRTTVDLQLVDRVDDPAAMMFVGDFDMVLRAGDPNAWTFWEGAMAEMGLPTETSVYGVFPHQHTLGTQLQIDFLDGDDAHCFTRVNDWDFNWQQTNFFERPVQIGPEDRMRITCRYDTLARDAIVPWGDGTQDEMCLAVLYLTFNVAETSVSPALVGERVTLPSGDGDHFGPNLRQLSASSVGGRSYTGLSHLRYTPSGGTVVGIDTENSAMRLGSELVTLPGEGDGLVLAYDSEGALSWKQIFGGPGDDGITDVVVDDAGNIYTVGWMESELTLGETTLSYGGARDVFVARLSPEGVVQWAVNFPGPRSSTPRKLEVAPDGSIAVGLYFSGEVQVGDSIASSEGDASAGLAVWLSPEGTVRMFDVCTSDQACQVRAVAFTQNSDLLVAGRYLGVASIAGATQISAGSWDGYLARYTAEGELVWIKTFGERAWDYIDEIELGQSGEIFVTGRYAGALRLGDQSVFFEGGSDAFVAELSDTGEVRWLTSFGGVATDYGTDLVSDGAQGVWVTVGREGPIDAGGGLLKRGGGTDLALIHLDGEGGHLASYSFGGEAGDYSGYLDKRGSDLLLGWTAYGPVEVGGAPIGGSSAGEAVMVQLGL